MKKKLAIKRMDIWKNILIIAIISFIPVEIMAQRIFVPSEEGVMVELKENGISGKFWSTLLRPNFPRKMPEVVTEPLKIYIYADFEIEQQEIYIQQITQYKQGLLFLPSPGNKGIKKYNQKNHSTFSKIAPNIYEFVLPANFFKQIDEDDIAVAKVDKWSKAPVKQFVICFSPNKQNKKQGKKDSFWYANISQLPYDSDDISDWSNEQAIESVNQIISEGKTTEQLFASIKPQEPQIVNGQQIQYVVVQNQPAGSTQDNNQNIQNEEKEEIISDIDKNIPYRDINNENTFALIIANEDYNKVAPVNFAKRDGQKISEYLKKTLGIGKDHIAYLENATLNDMRYEVNRLSKISDAYNGEASFIIYYIGHGIPDEKNGNGYLLPVDGYGNDVSTAYPLADLYSQLSNLEAKKIVLFTDACFSGANKSGDMLVAARGIAIRSNPNEAKGHLIAFSACQGDETAYSYDEQGHGLLTYYFLKKLKETGGQTTLGELEEYIVDNVGKTAIIINGKSQTPRVSVSPELQETWKEITFYE